MGNAYFGGIVKLRVEDYVAVGGHDNTYSGWGVRTRTSKNGFGRRSWQSNLPRGMWLTLKNGLETHDSELNWGQVTAHPKSRGRYPVYPTS